VDEIVDRTDGVPLFLEELTKAVLETANSGFDRGKRVAPIVIWDLRIAFGSRDKGCQGLPYLARLGT
jgi:hypothetical protein